MSVYKQALIQIYAAMGPIVPPCIKCDGCISEWAYALETIEETLGKEEIEKLFPWRHKIVKEPK